VPTVQIPDYGGGSLINLVAELESRLTGRAAAATLHPPIAAAIPHGATYVLLLADGLGAGQIGHRSAAPLRESLAATIDAPFPTTTTVSWASIATGLAPSSHGLIAYQLYLPEVGGVVYTIKWKQPGGEDFALDFEGFLPSPNLWERLAASGTEAITVQPANFQGSRLSRVLFRGCRFEPAYTADELIAATTQLAATPGRLIVTYLPHVDVAAHMYGQSSTEYADAVAFVSAVWEQLQLQLPAAAVLVGTADHGHVDFSQSAARTIDRDLAGDRILYGDSRVMFVKGDGADLAAGLPATWMEFAEVAHWWGPGPHHPRFAERAPDGLIVAADDALIHHQFSDRRMIGYHGGLTAAEREIPLLVGRYQDS
jgi:hypothetical protein